jgi:hypothetical protein
MENSVFPNAEENQPPDTTTPHGVDCMALWGENWKAPDSIIAGSGAYVHRLHCRESVIDSAPAVFPEY